MFKSVFELFRDDALSVKACHVRFSDRKRLDDETVVSQDELPVEGVALSRRNVALVGSGELSKGGEQWVLSLLKKKGDSLRPYSRFVEIAKGAQFLSCPSLEPDDGVYG